jgi:hypothetical protein
MPTLPRVKNALRRAHASLKPDVVDLAYMLDLEPGGGECIVVYVTVSERSEPSIERTWAIEAKIRAEIARANDLPVYFRWWTDAERRAEEGRATTKGGLFDWPHSALR